MSCCWNNEDEYNLKTKKKKKNSITFSKTIAFSKDYILD